MWTEDRVLPVQGLDRCAVIDQGVFLCSSEEAMRKAGTAHTKSSNDMENHVYIKAKSRVSTDDETDAGLSCQDCKEIQVQASLFPVCCSFRMSICLWWRG